MSAARKKKGPAKPRASGPTQPEAARKRVVVPTRLHRDVVAEIRVLAEACGVSVSAVVELCVTIGLRSKALPAALSVAVRAGRGEL